MLLAEEVAAFVYLMASQRGGERAAGLESLNSSVIASVASSAFRKRPEVQSVLQRHADAPRRPRIGSCRNTLSRLRGENEDLRRRLAVYEDHLRRLATENVDLRVKLVRLGDVGDLAVHRLRRSSEAR
jgi:hypothetical protein